MAEEGGGGSGGGTPTPNVAPPIGAPNVDPSKLLPPPTFTGVDGKQFGLGDPAITPKTGRARWEELLKLAPTDSAEIYDNWILSIPEDANDIEFTLLLRAEKQRVREAKFKRESGAQAIQDATMPTDKGPTPEEQLVSEKQSAQKGKAEKTVLDYQKSEPIIKGWPITPADAAANSEQGGGQSPFLDQFAKDQAIDLSRPNEEALARSGYYVYAGTEKDPNGYERPVYLFLEDAKAQINKLPQAKIKEYQRRLELPETGIVEGPIREMWDYAVARAAEYARAGQKVTVEFIFNALVSAAEAELKKNGGRGGGGGGAGPDPLTEDDYYMSMMQVLGDISGVEDSTLG